jgi:hypothetical protein
MWYDHCMTASKHLVKDCKPFCAHCSGKDMICIQKIRYCREQLPAVTQVRKPTLHASYSLRRQRTEEQFDTQKRVVRHALRQAHTQRNSCTRQRGHRTTPRNRGAKGTRGRGRPPSCGLSIEARTSTCGIGSCMPRVRVSWRVVHVRAKPHQLPI